MIPEPPHDPRASAVIPEPRHEPRASAMIPEHLSEASSAELLPPGEREAVADWQQYHDHAVVVERVLVELPDRRSGGMIV